MSARIRGHYRIDSAGRVESMLDVNGPSMIFHTPPQVVGNQRNSRLVRISIVGFVAMAIGVGGMLALPQIQRAIISAQAAQFASLRHMHGRHMHAAAAKLLHPDATPRD